MTTRLTTSAASAADQPVSGFFMCPRRDRSGAWMEPRPPTARSLSEPYVENKRDDTVDSHEPPYHSTNTHAAITSNVNPLPQMPSHSMSIRKKEKKKHDHHTKQRRGNAPGHRLL